jgi:hypothetical protein
MRDSLTPSPSVDLESGDDAGEEESGEGGNIMDTDSQGSPILIEYVHLLDWFPFSPIQDL